MDWTVYSTHVMSDCFVHVCFQNKLTQHNHFHRVGVASWAQDYCTNSVVSTVLGPSSALCSFRLFPGVTKCPVPLSNNAIYRMGCTYLHQAPPTPPCRQAPPTLPPSHPCPVFLQTPSGSRPERRTQGSCWSHRLPQQQGAGVTGRRSQKKSRHRWSHCHG